MDALSAELQDFLIRLGSRPESVSHKMEHYIEHLLHLLDHDDEQMLRQYYGLFGSQVLPLDHIADGHGTSADSTLKTIESCLRRLAVTPEWQMLRQMV